MSSSRGCLWSARKRHTHIHVAHTRAHTHACTHMPHITHLAHFVLGAFLHITRAPGCGCAKVSLSYDMPKFYYVDSVVVTFQHKPVGGTFQHNSVACTSQNNSRDSRRCRVGGRAYHCVLASTFAGQVQVSTAQGSTGLRSCSAHLVPSPQPFAISI